jgi:hypothetical protein
MKVPVPLSLNEAAIDKFRKMKPGSTEFEPDTTLDALP